MRDNTRSHVTQDPDELNYQWHFLINFWPLKIFKTKYFDFKDLNQNSARLIIRVLTKEHTYQVSNFNNTILINQI